MPLECFGELSPFFKFYKPTVHDVISTKQTDTVSDYSWSAKKPDLPLGSS